MDPKQKRASFDWLALWILFSAWASASGWGLSALRCLNVAGIIVSYALFLGGLILFRSHFRTPARRPVWRLFHSRFLAPKIWLILMLLAFAGAVTHAPTNYDYLSYRFPRVLNWTWDQGWSWISTVNQRMNYSGTGFEWLMVPLFLLLKTDRLFFLINFFSYLLLPGLVFSVFSRLRISRRVSWWWTWLLPAGYCYILQAASTGNDCLAAVYFLASLHFLFKTREASPVKNLVLSCLAIALMTGTKASNLPLVLPWLVLLFFEGRVLFEKVRPAIGVMTAAVLISALVSFLPVALINIHFTGDFAGDPSNGEHMKVKNPLIGMAGNSLQLAKDNLAPPLLPRSIDWAPLLPASTREALRRGFPRLNLEMGELQIEEAAGPGLGIVLVLAYFVFGGIRARVTRDGLKAARSSQALWVIAAGVVALLVYMSKIASESGSRLVAAYYPLLIAGVLVLASLDGRIIHRTVFRWCAYLALLSAIPLVILCPARPLFPVQAVAGLLGKFHVPAATLARYDQVYRVYGMRADAFDSLTKAIPSGDPALGLVQSGDDPEADLWRPFGSRRVIEVSPENSLAEVKARGIRFVVINDDALTYHDHITFASLAAKWSGTLAARKSLILKVHRGPETWYLLAL